MKKNEAISILATSVRPIEQKERARYDEAVKIAVDALNEPERKTGKWIKIPEFCGDDVSGFIDNHFSCSECKKEAEINSYGFYILSEF